MASISITPASVLKSLNGNTEQGFIGGSGLTITQGMALYKNSSGTFEKADCDAGSAGDAIRGTNGVYLALSAGSTGQPITVLQSDFGSSLAAGLVIGASLTDADVIYLSPTAGELTVTLGDLSAGDSKIVCGIVYTDGTVRWQTLPGGVI